MRVLRLGDVVELLRRCGRHRGRATLQALVDQHSTTTFTRSEAEELFLSLVRQAQLPSRGCDRPAGGRPQLRAQRRPIESRRACSRRS
jgi:hypothetical protein